MLVSFLRVCSANLSSQEKFSLGGSTVFSNCTASSLISSASLTGKSLIAVYILQGDFYEQVEGMTMGSPLAPVIAQFFMEKLECKALEQDPLEPLISRRYVDDTFVV